MRGLITFIYLQMKVFRLEYNNGTIIYKKHMFNKITSNVRIINFNVKYIYENKSIQNTIKILPELLDIQRSRHFFIQWNT